MAAAIAAYRAGNAPQIVQVFEVGTATMMAAKGAVKPVYQVMAEAGEKFDPKGFLAAVYSATTPTPGPPDLDAVQQLDAGALHQQGRVQEGRPRSRPSRRRRGRRSAPAMAKLKASGARVRVHDRLAVVGAARKLQRVAQRAVRHAAERLRRPRHEARVQRSGAGRAHQQHAGLDQEGLLRLQAAARTSRRRSSRAANAR